MRVKAPLLQQKWWTPCLPLRSLDEGLTRARALRAGLGYAMLAGGAGSVFRREQ
jgi:hypothetical protein